jgi:predicted enzyme related to lactoylglutathione lyase
MTNPVTHWQILTKQPRKLEEFYSALFGWRFSGDNPLGYKFVSTTGEGGIGGGIWPISQNEGRSMVQLFVRVDNVSDRVKKAEELGATVIVPPQQLPGGDEMAVLVDPDGIPFGLFKGPGNRPG